MRMFQFDTNTKKKNIFYFFAFKVISDIDIHIYLFDQFVFLLSIPAY